MTEPDLIAQLFRANGVTAPWAPLPATGVANDIYATNEVILRVATDHPDAISDARTESVAAPVALQAGIRTPRLFAFVDSRQLIDRPYSLWERIHGETVGVFAPDARDVLGLWAEVGRELGLLHERVQECPDPNGWLDIVEYGDPNEHLDGAIASGQLSIDDAARLERWLTRLAAVASQPAAPHFLHNDLHAMNVMCSRAGELLALIDWGDAGWGDRAIEFTDMPAAALPIAVDAYETVAPGALGEGAKARILSYRLARMLNRMARGVDQRRCLGDLFEFAQSAPAPWRAHLS